VVHAGDVQIEALPAAHTVPAVGYAVVDRAHPDKGAWVFTGDTGPNPLLWQRLAQIKVHSLIIETAFRDDEHQLADISRHLCPKRLREEVAQLREPTDIYITHIKPGEVDAVMTEISAQATPHRVRALVNGQSMSL
jgi:ribonuclease BN (tRNA processing enzyme)